MVATDNIFGPGKCGYHGSTIQCAVHTPTHSVEPLTCAGVPASQRCSSNDGRGGAGGSGPNLVSTLETATLLSCIEAPLLSGTGDWS